MGFLIRGGYQIYFGGDTDLFPEIRDLGNDLDVALLPISGWGLTLGAGHVDPLRAAQSLIHLCPRTAIPIHWGTCRPIGFRWMGLPYLSRPPRDFAGHAADLAPDVDVCILEPGHYLDLTRRRVDGS
ncbi:MAG TPA: MBL fold metallo-hydrolase [Anaerolineae bacterium]|nr:MBL fold metallo-hydrolase [Anaerolineae bacterium]